MKKRLESQYCETGASNGHSHAAGEGHSYHRQHRVVMRYVPAQRVLGHYKTRKMKTFHHKGLGSGPPKIQVDVINSVGGVC